MGGEKLNQIWCSDVPTGSPPRGRGKVSLMVKVSAGQGITPAWAGKRWTVAGIGRGKWDHPRVGGEKPRHGGGAMQGRASPPHGRGKDSGTVHGCGQLRITPALAGKSL